LQLSHHVQSKRSVYFVLDCAFEQYEWFRKCREFIHSTFEDLNDQDYFGLLHLQEGSLYNILLEEAGKNREMKRNVLDSFMNLDIEGKIKRRNRVAVWMEEVIFASRALPITTINYRGSIYEDPAKWVVVFIGSFKDLFNLQGMETGSDPKTNLLIVCMTNETIDEESVEYVKQLIKMTNQGGFLIGRYNEADQMDDQGFEDKVD